MQLGPHDHGRWLRMPDTRDGVRVEVLFEPSGTMHVRRTIPERLMDALKRDEAVSRDLLRKGTLLGGTQKHWLKVGSLPKGLHMTLKERFGSDQKAWGKWWNDPDNRAFRSSEHRV